MYPTPYGFIQELHALFLEDRFEYLKGNGLYGRGLIAGRGKYHSVQTGSGAHIAFYPVGTRGDFLGGRND
jgi:hypothetical protein